MHVVMYVSTLSLLMPQSYSVEWRSYFICCELLGRFHLLAVRKMPLRAFMYKFCVNTCFHFPWVDT